jgi:hypothetical protein
MRLELSKEQCHDLALIGMTSYDLKMKIEQVIDELGCECEWLNRDIRGYLIDLCSEYDIDQALIDELAQDAAVYSDFYSRHVEELTGRKLFRPKVNVN